MTGAEETEFVTFRTKRRSFHFSAVLSRSIEGEIRRVLSSDTSHVTVFVMREDVLIDSLRTRFNWPRQYICASVFAQRENLTPGISGMSLDITGSPFCRRACLFADATTPSQTALRHRDLHATLLYEFCMKRGRFLGQEMRATVAYFEAHSSQSRQPRRDESRDPPARRRRSRSRSRARSRSRSRSRPRHH